MTQIYGEPGEEHGDRLVYEALKYLPNDYLIYAQKKLVYCRTERNPDYLIVHRELGVIVIEVKDWIQVEKRDEKYAWVQRQASGKVEPETSPVEQARNAAHILANKLKRNSDLCNYAGKLNFPYRYAGALPHLARATIIWLEKEWGEGTLLGRDDLTADRIREKIQNIPAPFYVPMTESQFNAVRAIIDPMNCAKEPVTGRFKGVYNEQQEAIAKEPLKSDDRESQEKDKKGDEASLSSQEAFFSEITPSPDHRRELLSETAPTEVTQLKESSFVRLVRGYAGTGKTDVMILRAHHLHKQYPQKDILMTTFNRPLMEERLKPAVKDVADVFTFDQLCNRIFQKKHGQSSNPQSTEGILMHLAPEIPLIEKFGLNFLTDEIVWIKENHLTERQKYLDTQREGRAGLSRPLNRNQKVQIFDLFERYEADLHDVAPHDWPDLHEKVLGYLNSGIKPDKLYDVILVDEAQHFAPSWMQIVRYFLKPEGEFFLSDDPSQSVYRLYSWRQRGIEVVGRTRWLRIPYRNTRQIFEAAYTLIASNPVSRKMLEESDGLTQPDLENNFLREGEQPQVYHFENQTKEMEFVKNKIVGLIGNGFLPSEICLLHTKKYVIQNYRDSLPKGVEVDDLRRRTGMEYPTVFIPKVQDLFDRDSQDNWDIDLAKQQLMFYMAMTRARDHLYMLYEQKWPKALEPIQSKVIWHL